MKKYFNVKKWRIDNSYILKENNIPDENSSLKEYTEINTLVPNVLYRAIWRDNQYGAEVDELFIEVGKKIGVEQAKEILNKKFGYPDDIVKSNMKEYSDARRDLNIQLDHIKDKLQNLKVKIN